MERYVAIKPAIVRIGRTTYRGAFYVDGVTERLYLVGPLPASWLHKHSTRYHKHGHAYASEADKLWYIAGWYVPRTVPDTSNHAEFHPFGANIVLMVDNYAYSHGSPPSMPMHVQLVID